MPATLRREVEVESREEHRRSITATVVVTFTLPNPLGGDGLNLGFQDAERFDSRLVGLIVRESRLAILKRLQYVTGGIPRGGVRVLIGLLVPPAWTSIVPDEERMAADIARSVGNAIADALKA